MFMVLMKSMSIILDSMMIVSNEIVSIKILMFVVTIKVMRPFNVVTTR